MVNLKMFEEYSSSQPKTMELLMSQTLEFLIPDENPETLNLKRKRSFPYKPTTSTFKTAKKLEKKLTEYGYSVTYYPKLSDQENKLLAIKNRLDYSDEIGWDYGPLLLVELSGSEKCAIYLDKGDKQGKHSVHFQKIERGFEVIYFKKATESEIHCLFWNEKEMVEGKFEDVDRHIEPGKDREDPIYITFVSYETSDKKEYFIEGEFYGTYEAGYEFESIYDMGFYEEEK